MASRRRLKTAVLLAAIASLVATGLAASQGARHAGAPPPSPHAPAPRPLRAPAPRPAVPWVARLYPLHIENENTHAQANLLLYRRNGEVDPRAVEAFSAVAVLRGDEVRPLRTRLVQLAFKTAYHFGVARLVILSAYRPHAGFHSKCAALDFKLPGIRATKLAAWLRRLPRAGVGVYTNPRTQFVHLDVRSMSYHWLDASPPHVTWRGLHLPDPTYRARDASYTPASDLPLAGPGTRKTGTAARRSRR